MKISLFVCLAFALALPGRAWAQGDQQQQPGPPAIVEPLPAAAVAAPVPSSAGANHALRLPIAVWTASVAADQVTTYMFSSRYPGLLHERNVMVRGLDGHPALLVAAGTAIDVTTGWAARRLLSGHPKLAKVVFYGAAAYRSYLAIYNIRMMRRAEAIRSARGPGLP